MAVNLHTTHYRFGIDELAESTHGWYAAEDANPAQGVIGYGVFLLRFNVQETGGTAAGNVDNQFQCRLNGGAWQNVTTTSTIVRAVAAIPFTNGQDATKRLSGTGTFEASGDGCTEDGLSGGPQNDIAASGCSETECGLQIQDADVIGGDVIEFQITSPDFPVTNDVVPAITVPLDATRGLISWAETEAPFVGTRGLFSWAEAELPLAPTRGLASWAELETPSVAASPTRGLVSQAELESPFAPTRGLGSWFELETPLQATRGLVSQCELEAPFVLTRGLLSQTEFESPLAPTRGLNSWVELEAPSSASPTQGQISWAEIELPALGTRGLISWVEGQVPSRSAQHLVSLTILDEIIDPMR